MKPYLLIIGAMALFGAGLLIGANNQPILVGGSSPYIGLPPASPLPKILANSSGAISINAGGSNQNVSVTPGTTGALDVLNTNGTATAILSGSRIGSNDLAVLESFNFGQLSGVPTAQIAFRNTTANAGDGTIELRPGTAGVPAMKVTLLPNGNMGFGANASPGYPVDATGDINASGVFRQAGTAGITMSLGVRNSANTGTCTITIAGGIITGTSGC